MAAVCSGWRSAPRGSMCVVYPWVPVPRGGNYLDEQHEREEGLVCVYVEGRDHGRVVYLDAQT